MTDLPTTGGSYVRDPLTGDLLRSSPQTDTEGPQEPNLPAPEPEVAAVADITPAADPAATPEEPAPSRRRSTSKGGI